MKTAIYIEDGTVQLVITPETAFEKNSLSTLREKNIDAKLFSGAFYDCRGGWVRQTTYKRNPGLYSNDSGLEDFSLILRASEKETTT